MSKCKRVVLAIFISLFLINEDSFSQVVHSPYSSIGLGAIQDPTTAAKFGIGGLGVSNPTYYSLNIVNPALLHYNRVALFSVAVLGETTSIGQGTETSNAGSGQLNHIALAFPLISGKLSTSVALNPYSAVNYNIRYQAPIEGHPTDTAIFIGKGDGGIDQLSLAVGGELFKGFSLGLRANYLFSSIRKETTSYIPLSTASNTYISSLNERLSFSDFLFGAGFAYSLSLKENTSINIGATYDLKTDINSKYFVRMDQTQITGSTIFGDTLSNNAPIKVKIPSKLIVGLSYSYDNKLVIGADYSLQDWSNSSEEFILTKREKYVLGVEITPDVTSMNNYLKKITYRFGASYTNTPYIFEETQIKDFGINFGLSLPVVRFSSVDFGVQVGNRGTLANNLIQENYFKVYFGVSFNDNRWFLRPKFN